MINFTFQFEISISKWEIFHLLLDRRSKRWMGMGLQVLDFLKPVNLGGCNGTFKAFNDEEIWKDVDVRVCVRRYR